MANTHTQTLTNPSNADAGSRRTDTLFSELQKTINVSQANRQNCTVMSVSFPDDIGLVDSSNDQMHGGSHDHDPAGAEQTTFGPPMSWRVPILDYSDLQIWVIHEKILNGAVAADTKLTFKSSQGSTDVLINGSITQTSLSVTPAQPAALNGAGIFPEDEIIDMFVTCKNGGKFRIHTITFYYTPTIPSLPAGFTHQPFDKNGDKHFFQGLGENQFSANRPMSAAVGRVLIENLNALNRRVEPGLCWSAFRLFAFNQYANHSWQWYDQATPSLIRIRKAETDPPRIVFWVHAENTGTEPAAFVVCVTGAADLRLSNGIWPRGHDRPNYNLYVKSQTVPGNSNSWYQIVTPPLDFATRIGPESPDLAIQAGVLSSSTHLNYGGQNMRDIDQSFGNDPDDTSNTYTEKAIPRMLIRAISIWARP